MNFVYKSKQMRTKKGLNLSEQPFSLFAIGGDTPLNATCLTLIFGIAANHILAISRILSPKFNIIKDFRVFSRQVSTIGQPDTLKVDGSRLPEYQEKPYTKTRLRPALMVKTDNVDTLGARPSNQDGKRFPTINLCIEPVRHGARTDIYRLGVPKV